VYFGISLTITISNERDNAPSRAINLAIVAANNHCAGFGPETANTFRKMLNLSEVTWDNISAPNRRTGNTKQTILSDCWNEIEGSNIEA